MSLLIGFGTRLLHVNSLIVNYRTVFDTLRMNGSTNQFNPPETPEYVQSTYIAIPFVVNSYSLLLLHLCPLSSCQPRPLCPHPIANLNSVLPVRVMAS